MVQIRINKTMIGDEIEKEKKAKLSKKELLK